MGVTPLVLWGRRAGVPGPSRLASGRYGMLAMHDRVRRTGGFPGQLEIEANAGKRLVETGLVDLLGIRNALDRRDQIVPRSEREIIVQVFVAIDRHSHSVSDTFYGIFPCFACAFLLLNWVAAQSSED